MQDSRLFDSGGSIVTLKRSDIKMLINRIKYLRVRKNTRVRSDIACINSTVSAFI